MEIYAFSSKPAFHLQVLWQILQDWAAYQLEWNRIGSAFFSDGFCWTYGCFSFLFLGAFLWQSRFYLWNWGRLRRLQFITASCRYHLPWRIGLRVDLWTDKSHQLWPVVPNKSSILSNCRMTLTHRATQLVALAVGLPFIKLKICVVMLVAMRNERDSIVLNFWLAGWLHSY